MRIIRGVKMKQIYLFFLCNFLNTREIKTIRKYVPITNHLILVITNILYTLQMFDVSHSEALKMI